jgi:hypothetical protein
MHEIPIARAQTSASSPPGWLRSRRPPGLCEDGPSLPSQIAIARRVGRNRSSRRRSRLATAFIGSAPKLISGHIDVLHNHDQGIWAVYVNVGFRLISIQRIAGFVPHHEAYRPARRTKRFEFPDAPFEDSSRRHRHLIAAVWCRLTA